VLTPQQQAALQEFKPEEARTLELGTKLDLADHTLRLNLAVFSSDYKDMQLTYRGPAPNGVAPFITNAGKTSIDGAEAELTWAPAEALLVDGSVGYLDATIDDLSNIAFAILPPGLQQGNTLPFAPRWMAHLGLQYTAHAGRYAIVPRVDAAYQSKTFFDATNTPEIAQLEGVTRLNASLVFRDTEAKWRITAGVNNLTDELYQVAGNSSLSTGSGYAEVAYARPREWFINAQFDF
jgi:iron complex outermembrane receptor protein